jgi:hypothetical protein
MGCGTSDATDAAAHGGCERAQRWSKVISDMASPVLGPFCAALVLGQAKIGNARSLPRAAMNASANR